MITSLTALTLLVAFGVPVAVSDFRTKTVSNRLVMLFTLASFAGYGFLVLTRSIAVTPALFAAFLALGVFLLLYLVGRGGLGEADVKLAPAIGLLVALGSLQSVFTWLVVTFLLAGGFALVQLLRKRLGLQDTFAFAPHMFGAAIITVLMS